jgi:putative acetyltransferase
MRIAEASPTDLDDVLAVERLAFAGDAEAGLVSELLEDRTARPIVSLLAWDGEKPVGHIMFTAAHLEGARRDVSASILAPLAVIPDAQRRGIGGALIEAGVLRLSESGVELVFVLGHPAYYPRHGFAPATRLGLTPPYPVEPEEAWMVRALRARVIGTVRGTLACADALSSPELWRE